MFPSVCVSKPRISNKLFIVYLGLLPILLHIAKITADAIKLYSTTNGYKYGAA